MLLPVFPTPKFLVLVKAVAAVVVLCAAVMPAGGAGAADPPLHHLARLVADLCAHDSQCMAVFAADDRATVAQTVLAMLEAGGVGEKMAGLLGAVAAEPANRERVVAAFLDQFRANPATTRTVEARASQHATQLIFGALGAALAVFVAFFIIAAAKTPAAPS